MDVKLMDVGTGCTSIGTYPAAEGLERVHRFLAIHGVSKGGTDLVEENYALSRSVLAHVVWTTSSVGG